jgi:hypothetical protein
MTYRVLDTEFTMHAARDLTCMHARMSWPLASKELLAAMPEWRCDARPPGPSASHKLPCAINSHYDCLLCKTESTPVVGRLTQALLSRFYFRSLTVYP